MLVVMGLFDIDHWMQMLLFGVSTFLMVVLNNSNSLIRVFSRMVSCSFMVLSLMIPSLFDSLEGGISQVMCIIALLFFLDSYQDRRSMGKIFFAFSCLGVVSTQFFQVLFFLPFIWFLLFTSLQSGSLKVIVASILGILAPYWFWLCWCLHNGCHTCILDHVMTVTDFGPIAEGLFTPQLIIPILLIATLGIAGTVHFLANSFADNIKTRMFYNVFIMLFFATLIFIVLQPQHSDYLLRILIICASPLVAHFFTFTNTWLTNLSFYAVLVTTIVITVLNTWIF